MTPLKSQAACEDVIQLQGPVPTVSGEVVNQITIGAGSSIIIPIKAVNLSEAIWGPDAKEFKPERWLEDEIGLTPKSKEMPGYHHLLSFIDGPRTCLGKQFAVAEFKVCACLFSESPSCCLISKIRPDSGGTERPHP